MSDEDRSLSIGDPVAVECGRACHDEQLITVDVDLRQLVSVDRILDGKWMKAILCLQGPHFLARRIADADPHEFRFVRRAVDPLVDGDRANALAVAVKKSGDDSHEALGTE